MSELNNLFSDDAFEGIDTPFEEVEVEEVEVTPPQRQLVKEPVKTQVAKQVTKPAFDDFELDLPDGMEQGMEEMGVVVGEMGVKISKVPIDKFKATTTKTDRISFVMKKVIAIKTHFIDKKGQVICFGGKCCELKGAPSIRYLFPVVVYNTDNDGVPLNNKMEFRILSAGDDLYKSILTINRGYADRGGIDHADLLVTCTDDKFQKIQLTPCGEALWRKSDVAKKFIESRWKKDGSFAYQAVARKVDETSFLQLLGVTPGAATPPAPQEASMPVTGDLSKFFE